MKARSVAEVLALYERWGDRHYDEELSQQAHALQSAAQARAEGATDELVAAALLHDVGHLLELADDRRASERDADLRHEARGARYLDAVFGPAVTAPIALHVRAKRYLCAVDASYHDDLSEGSRRSLARQGGPFDRDEATTFEAEPGWEDAVRLRRWDDRGKVLGLDVAPLDDYRSLLASTATVAR